MSGTAGSGRRILDLDPALLDRKPKQLSGASGSASPRAGPSWSPRSSSWTKVQPRRQSCACRPAARSPSCSAAPRHHHGLRHPRPGRGDDHGEPGRRAVRRAAPAVRLAARASTTNSVNQSWRLHRLPGDEPAHGAADGIRRPAVGGRHSSSSGVNAAARGGPGRASSSLSRPEHLHLTEPSLPTETGPAARPTWPHEVLLVRASAPTPSAACPARRRRRLDRGPRGASRRLRAAASLRVQPDDVFAFNPATYARLVG